MMQMIPLELELITAQLFPLIETLTLLSNPCPDIVKLSPPVMGNINLSYIRT